MTPLAPLALTMGEPAGIGTEIALKAYARLATEPPGRAPVFCLIDDPARVEMAARAVGVGVRVATIEHPRDAEATFASALPVMPVDDGPAGP